MILAPLPESYRAGAAALFWGAFSGKLGRVLGPDDRARAFIARVMRPDHAIAALDGPRLLGIAGFKTPEGSFVGGSLRDLLAIYGPSALWRSAALALLERDVDNTNFLMDGIAVAPEARGRGVGTALLTAIGQEALRRGYRSVRLDVISTNPRARALYEREGFVAGRSDSSPIARMLFDIPASTRMIKPL